MINQIKAFFTRLRDAVSPPAEPIDYGQPKANVYFAMRNLETERPNTRSSLYCKGHWIPYEEGRLLAEEFLISHFVGERHITEAGYIVSGFIEDLPYIRAYLIMEPETYQQILWLYGEFSGQHNQNADVDPHFLPELQLPSKPYGMPEDTIKWDAIKSKPFLDWCHENYYYRFPTARSVKELELQHQYQDIRGTMGDWNI